MRKQLFLSILAAAALGWSAPAAAGNLLFDGGFESYKESSFLGIPTTSFDEWTWNGNGVFAEKSDVYEGATAMGVEPNRLGTLEQDVALPDGDYAPGTIFELTIHYKVLSLSADGNVSVDCYWTPLGGADGDAMKALEADKLQRIICESVTSEWQTFTVQTTKPVNSSKFLVRVQASKGSKVLFDAFELAQTENTEPYITISPEKLQAVSTTLGESVDFQTIHISQGNVTGNTVFQLSYTDADQFRLSQTSLGAGESGCDLIVTYAPTKAGTHTALLYIDNLAHPSLFQSVVLSGSCTDPSKTPVLTVTPTALPTFEAVAGQQATQRITVSSEDCTDFVYLSVSHIQGQAFLISSGMLPQNGESEVTVTFAPQTEGTYRSVVTIQTEGAAPVVLTLNGTATAKSAETADWATDFVWDETHPLALLNEPFDDVEHNKTLQLSGWQNVAKADARPWWGFDEAKTTPVRGTNRCAKATAYQYQTEETGTWEMWLVTPALDYKKAEGKIFAFSVMGEYMPDEGNPAKLELVYIDATNPNNVFYQLFDDLSIPSKADENNLWVPFQIHLEDQPNMDIFHMAFRFTSPNGTAGGVTYYIDDVSWGRTDLPEVVDPRESIDQVQGARMQCKKVLRDGQLLLIIGDRIYTAGGARIE